MRRVFPLLTLLLLALAACGDDDTTGPPAATFAGTWDATEIELVSTANANTRVELVALGATGVLTLTSAGAFTVVVTVPGYDGINATGTWSASQDVLTMTFATGMFGQWQFDYTLAGDLLTMTGATSEYDFDDDGDDDDARLNLELERR